jgi:hypothetical protein
VPPVSLVVRSEEGVMLTAAKSPVSHINIQMPAAPCITVYAAQLLHQETKHVADAWRIRKGRIHV